MNDSTTTYQWRTGAGVVAMELLSEPAAKAWMEMQLLKDHTDFYCTLKLFKVVKTISVTPV